MSLEAILNRRNPHDLRHTYAAIMLMAHLSPDYVQKQLKHSSISITVDTLGHWIPGEGRKGLEEVLGGGKVVRNRVQKPHIFPYIRKGLQQPTETLSEKICLVPRAGNGGSIISLLANYLNSYSFP